MVNETTIGRMKCPVCGEENQDVKVNKNGNLYMICDNQCRINFSKKHTKKFKPVLLSGKNVNENGIYITSIKGVENGTIREQSRAIDINATLTKAPTTNRNSGVATIRRTDGQLAGSSTGKSEQPRKRGFIADFILGDDDE